MIKILILTEGSSQIGFGHITRCLSLLDALKDRSDVTLEINGDESVIGLVKNEKIKIVNWLESEKTVNSESDQYDCIIIDSYLASRDFYQRLAEKTKLAIFIDDFERLDYPKGIILNASAGINLNNYHQKETQDYLLGLNYVLLRPEFLKIQKKEIKKEISSIMVTFGGDDFRNMTPKILEFLTENFPKITKNVVIGKGFKQVAEIKKLADFHTNLIFYPTVQKMREAMLASDIAISAAGQTLNELAITGLPVISVMVADNQVKHLKGWQETGFITHAGLWDDKNILSRINSSIDTLSAQTERAKKSEIGQKLIDGRGTDRVAKFIFNQIFAKDIILKSARAEDSSLVLTLANDPVVRSNSFNPDKIAPSEHHKWFGKILESPEDILFLAFFEDRFVGQVRFSLEKGEYIIGISLTQDFRGYGIGSLLIEKGLTKFEEEKPETSKIYAYVKEENIPSLKIFEKSGFVLESMQEIKGHKAYKLSYQYGE